MADPPADIVPAAVPPTFTIDPFDQHKMKWSRWVERLESAFVLFGVQDGVKLHMLLHYMGGETYDILCDKLAPERPHQKTYAQVVAALLTHFNPEPLEILENFRFHCRKQADERPEETIGEYLIALRKLAITCNFGNYLSTALRNQFVFGLKDRAIQSRLLEVRGLTLERAQEIAVSMELSNKGGQEIQAKQGRAEVNLVENSRRSAARAQAPRTNANKKQCENCEPQKWRGQCYRCGSDAHYADRCKHIRTQCNYCKVVGHLEKVCQKKHSAEGRGRDSEAHLLEEWEAGVSDEEVVTLDELCKLEITDKPQSSTFRLEIQVSCAKIRFDVDTGAPVSIISAEDKKKYFAADGLLPSDLQLVSFCGKKIPVYGMLNVSVVYGGKSLLLPLYVSYVNKHPLLGRQWMQALRVDLNAIAYADENKLETTPTAAASLETIPTAVETLVERPVPFSMRAAVESELDKPVYSGVLAKVDHIEWATSTLPVPKKFSEMRMCGDYKRFNEEMLNGISGNYEPCQFFTDKIKYCVCLINWTGVHKVKKITAIQDMLRAEHRYQIHGNVGIVDYNGVFFPNRSITLHALNNRRESGVCSEWSEKREETSKKIKQTTQSNEFQVDYNSTQPLSLAINTSPYGIGAVLSHLAGLERFSRLTVLMGNTTEETDYLEVSMIEIRPPIEDEFTKATTADYSVKCDANTNELSKEMSGKVYGIPEGVRVAVREYPTTRKYRELPDKLGNLHCGVELDDGRNWMRRIEQHGELDPSHSNRREQTMSVQIEETRTGTDQPNVPDQAVHSEDGSSSGATLSLTVPTVPCRLESRQSGRTTTHRRGDWEGLSVYLEY